MENINVIHQFILLRAHSMSLGRIAEELGVSKASLSGWDRKYAEYIKQMKVDAYEALREESRTLVTERLKGVIQGLEKLYSMGKLYPELNGIIPELFKLVDETEEPIIPKELQHIL
jgi:hypothetical protein